MRVGIEVGGTFTDLVAVDGSRVEVVKVPSTPSAPEIGAFNSLEAANIAAERVTDLVHGSTVATNAILERKGARIASRSPSAWMRAARSSFRSTRRRSAAS